MIDLRHKLKERKAYNLSVAIPLVGAAPVAGPGGVESVATERVLTLGPLEVRYGLPDAIVDSPEVANAIKAKWIQVLPQKAVQPQAGAKPSAAPEKALLSKASKSAKE